ncbi:hypothetical protein GGX14DRAFT_553394 [Mycena pura]|uniref:Zn(2)-C6 fungal-type domain-containing protein n=1 Tax=Mycena pura TaxID=153505 RepID=A0AAD7E5E4_9AGAR|nr:hypothetical protein GGX14DRAFT_553394 [Mycena pura]
MHQEGSRRSTPSAPQGMRTVVACLNCRMRKVKCMPTNEPPTNPCARCKMYNLICEYVSPGERERVRENDIADPDTPLATSWTHDQPMQGPPAASSAEPPASSPGRYPPHAAAGPERAPAQSTSYYQMQAAHAYQYLEKRRRGQRAPTHPGTGLGESVSGWSSDAPATRSGAYAAPSSSQYPSSLDPGKKKRSAEVARHFGAVDEGLRAVPVAFYGFRAAGSLPVPSGRKNTLEAGRFERATAVIIFRGGNGTGGVEIDTQIRLK